MHSVLWRLLRYARPHFGVLLLAFVGMAAVGLTTGAYAYLTGPTAGSAAPGP